ncbi:MAG: hypothetical protein EAZ57_10515, partial [Cytophagales bacterium]
MKQLSFFKSGIGLLLLFAFLYLHWPQAVMAQITTTPGVSLAEIKNKLTGAGVTIQNVEVVCPVGAYGSFRTTNRRGEIDSVCLGNEGIILTTGRANDAPRIVSDNASFTSGGTVGHPLMDSLAESITRDGCFIKFEVIPAGDTIRFNYTFGSEEYPEFVGAGFNDVFGFFISGPNPSGGSYVNRNLAVLPASAVPGGIVSIDNVNATTNSDYFYTNALAGPVRGRNIVYDGLTRCLVAIAHVIPCERYTIWLRIADAGDASFDSGVFVEKVSSSTIDISTNVDMVWDAGYTESGGACTPPTFTLSRGGGTSVPETYNFTYGGSAVTNAVVNPALFPTTTTLDIGVSDFAFDIAPIIYPNIDANGDTLRIYVYDRCNVEPFDSTDVIFSPPLRLGSTPEAIMDTVRICAGDTARIYSKRTYPFYTWHNGETDSLFTFTSLIPGTDTLVWLEVRNAADRSVACMSRDSMVIRVVPKTIFDLGDTVRRCEGDGPVVLNAGHPSHIPGVIQYEWFTLNTVSGVLTPTGGTASTENVLFSPGTDSVRRFYVVEVTDTLSKCVAYDTTAVVFHVKPISTLTISDADSSICQGETVTFTVASARAERYSFFVNGVLVQGPLATTTYTTSALNNGDVVSVIAYNIVGSLTCERAGPSIPVSVRPRPPVNILYGGVPTSLINLCDSSGAQSVTALHPLHGPTIKYQWNNITAGPPVPITTTPTLTVSSFGLSTIYEVVVTDTSSAARCSSRDTITVNFRPNPIAIINFAGMPEDSIVACNDTGSKTLSALHPSHTALIRYQWADITGGGYTIVSTSPTYVASSFSSTKVYELTVLDSAFITQCKSRDTIVVELNTNPIAQIKYGAATPTVINLCDSVGSALLVGTDPSHTAGVRYVWNELIAGVPTQVGNSGTFLADELSSMRTYELIVIDSGKTTYCQRRDTIMVNFNTNPVATIKHLGISKDTVRLC